MYFVFTAICSLVVFALVALFVGDAFGYPMEGHVVIMLLCACLVVTGIGCAVMFWFDNRETKERHKQRGQDMLVREIAAHTRAMRDAGQAVDRG